MSVDILYKNMAPHLNELFGDFSGYQLPKMSMHILYNNMVPLINKFFGDSSGYLLLKKDIFCKNNTSLPNKVFNESSDILVEKMSLDVLYKNMLSP